MSEKFRNKKHKKSRKVWNKTWQITKYPEKSLGINSHKPQKISLSSQNNLKRPKNTKIYFKKYRKSRIDFQIVIFNIKRAIYAFN